MTAQEQPSQLSVTVKLTRELAPGVLAAIRQTLNDVISLGASVSSVGLRIELEVGDGVDVAGVRKALQTMTTPQRKPTITTALCRLKGRRQLVANAILRLHEQGRAFRHGDVAADIRLYGGVVSGPTISRVIASFVAADYIIDPRKLGKPARTPLTLVDGAEEQILILLR